MTEEYIYLRDYVKVLWKRKWVVILVPIISVLTTAIFIYVFAGPKQQEQKDIYEAIATIQNGSIGGPILNKEDSFAMIIAYSGELKENIQFEDIKETLYFRMKLELKGKDKNLLKETCEKLIQDYLNKSNIFYNKEYQVYLDKLNMLKQRKQIFDEDVVRLQEALSKLSRIKGLKELELFDRTQKYNVNIRSAQLEMLSIENNILDIENALAKSKKFEIIGSITITKCESKKGLNKKEKLLISAVLGLIGGILMAIVIEKWERTGLTDIL